MMYDNPKMSKCPNCGGVQFMLTDNGHTKTMKCAKLSCSYEVVLDRGPVVIENRIPKGNVILE
jgi:hypothetical protein